MTLARYAYVYVCVTDDATHANSSLRYLTCASSICVYMCLGVWVGVSECVCYTAESQPTCC